MNRLLSWLVLRGFNLRRNGYTSFALLISILGVVVGVAALIIVNSVMTGFQSTIKRRLLASNADIIVMRRGGVFYKYLYAQAEVNKIPHVKAVEPFIYVPVMVSSPEGAYSGASVRGCDSSKEPMVTDIPRKLVLGNYRNFHKEMDGVLIGKTLANTLGISVGDNVTAVSPIGKKTPFGYIPTVIRFKVAGIFDVGMYQFDSGLLLAHIGYIRKVLGFGNAVTGLMVKVDNPDVAKVTEKLIEGRLGRNYIAKDWIEMNKNLFSAMKLERLSMLLILSLIVLVASFNISSLLMVSVNARAKDIAILKTIGVTNGFIVKIFVLYGFCVGFIGTVLGEILGISISILGERYKLISLPTDVYYIDHLPFQLHASDCIVAALIAMVISVIATIYPALKAAKTEPARVLSMES